MILSEQVIGEIDVSKKTDLLLNKLVDLTKEYLGNSVIVGDHFVFVEFDRLNDLSQYTDKEFIDIIPLFRDKLKDLSWIFKNCRVESKKITFDLRMYTSVFNLKTVFNFVRVNETDKKYYNQIFYDIKNKIKLNHTYILEDFELVDDYDKEDRISNATKMILKDFMKWWFVDELILE